MKPTRSLSVEEYKVIGRYEGLRATLLSERFAPHWEKPLAYWALRTDRRLPLALLGRSLGSLLNTPFAELSATPGIGDKKLRSFIQLLMRAAETDPAELAPETHPPCPNGAEPVECGPNGDADFEPGGVSEVVWSRWRGAVVRHGLGREKLGRFAPSLRHMTRVIWDRPLEYYAQRSLAEIRGMKTHGEKRVRAVLEVFHAVHALVACMGPQEHLVVRIVPRRIDAVENWIARVLQTPGIPSEQEILERFIEPLLEQVRTDAASAVTALAEKRLGFHGPISSVRQMAREMGLTRARVYQLLNEINDIVTVRWPTGRRQVYDLRAKFLAEAAEAEEPPCLERFHATIELFYPGGRRGAAGPLEAAPDSMRGEEETFEPELDEAESVGAAGAI